MRPVLLKLALVALPLLALPAGAGAQGQDPNTPVSAEAQAEPAGAVPAAAAPAQGASGAAYGGLPERAPQARTLRAYWHVFVAFAVTWLLLFGYALSVGRRFGRLDDEVQRLGRAAE